MSARLRALTINLWGRQPPLDRRLALARRQLAALAPDLIGVQEVQPLAGKPAAQPDEHVDTTAHRLADGLGYQVVYAPSLTWAPGGFGPDDPGGQEGLAVLSRWPVLEHRALPLPEARPTEARILLSVRVESPAGPLWFHTTHLHYRLDDGVAREHQVEAIDAAVRACGRGATDPPQVLCGDFNATADADEIRFLRGLHSLAGRRTHFQDAWLRLHPEPGPWDRARGPAAGLTWSSDNHHTRPLRSLDVDRRIDYLFVTTRKKDGRGTVHACDVVLTEREGDGADAVCASDHYGVLAEIQIEAGP